VPVSFIGGGNQGTWRKPFSLLQCHQNNKNAHKRKAHTNATCIDFFDFLHFETKLHVAESKLEMLCNIIDDFRQQYELALDEIYDLQGEIDELVDECRQQKHNIPTLNSKLYKIQKKEI
jgi:peptidoglycan hydrolase CwlO-like protein